MSQEIQALILAAGKGTRMLPLTETRPKPLQEVLGKNLIEWKLDALPEAVREVILVVGYQGKQIRDFFGTEWKGRTIRYAFQPELNGTGGALFVARELLRERFIVMMGDDLYAREDLERMMAHEWAIGVREVIRAEVGGELLTNPDGTFRGIREEKHFVEKGLRNTGLYMLNSCIFNYPLVPIGGSSTEFGLPHMLVEVAKDEPITLVPLTHWLQITTPEDLKRAEEFVMG